MSSLSSSLEGMKYIGACTALMNSPRSPPWAASSWQEGWKITPHLTSLVMAEVWNEAQPPQQKPTQPSALAPSALAYEMSALTLGSYALQGPIDLSHAIMSPPRLDKSNVGGRPSPSVPPSRGGVRSLGT